MSGKHAPASPRSFYFSLAKSAGGALAAVGLMLALVLVVLNNGDDKPEGSGPVIIQTPTSSPTFTTSPTASPSPTPTPTILPPDRVTVAVLNGTNRTGLARSTADRIRKAGYRVGTVGNSSSPEETSTIYYRPDARAEALAFQQRFSEFTAVKESTKLGGAILRAVIGSDFP